MNIPQLTIEQRIKQKTRAYNVEKRQGFHKQGKASFGLPTGYTGSVFVSSAMLSHLEGMK